MVAEFAAPIFDAGELVPGEILGPVRTEWGWHVMLYQGEAEAERPAPTQPPAPGPTPGLTLRHPGAEPRSVLAHAPIEGDAATVTMVAATDTSVTIEGLESIAYHTVHEMTWHVVVTDVFPDGSSRSEMKVARAGLRESQGTGETIEAMLRSQLEGMVGSSGWLLVDASGPLWRADWISRTTSIRCSRAPSRSR